MYIPGKSLVTDYSAHPPTIPAIGANFAASGPYASYVLLQTIPADSARQGIDIENLSGAQIAVVLDDGKTAAGSVPAAGKASVFALSGTAAAQQGGSWSSCLQCRVQVYAPASTAQVAIFTR
jgi:hypothetical protein